MRKRFYPAVGLAAVAAMALAAALSCGDLLSNPPAAVTVALSADPSVDPDINEADLNWETTAACQYVIEYGTTPGVYTLATPRTSEAASEHSATLSGLDSNTAYYFRIVCWSSGNRSFPSGEFSFMTDPNPATDIIVSGYAATPALNSIALSWTTNFAAKHLVEYGTASGVYSASTVLSATPETAHSVTLSGLAQDTIYYFRLRHTRDSGPDSVSIEYDSTTTAEPEPTAAQKARGIWLIGGLSGGAVTAPIEEVDLYDPVTGDWYENVTQVQEPVSFAGYAAYNGQLFVIGGFNSDGAVISDVQIYTIATDSWATGDTMPMPRANIYATVLDGKIYVLSGTSANYNVNWAAAGICYEYTPGSTWTNKSAYSVQANSERFSYGYGSTLYSIGGRGAAAGLATNALLDHNGIMPWISATGSLTTVAEIDMSAAPSVDRTGVAGVIYDAPDGTTDSLVLFGGFSAITNVTGCFVNYNSGAPIPTGTPSALVQFLAYPFSAPVAWSGNTVSGFPALAFGSAVVSRANANDRIYYFGGTSSLGSSPAVSSASYWISPPNPSAGYTWASSVNSVSTMPRARWGHGAVTLDE